MISNDHIPNTPQPDSLVWVTATGTPTREQKLVCIELVTRLADDGWVITGTVGEPITPLLRQATRAMGGSYIDTRVRAETDAGVGDGMAVPVVPRVLREAVAAGACAVQAGVMGERAVLYVHLLPPTPHPVAMTGPVAGLSAAGSLYEGLTILKLRRSRRVSGSLRRSPAGVGAVGQQVAFCDCPVARRTRRNTPLMHHRMYADHRGTAP